jgi:hypothetical protein
MGDGITVSGGGSVEVGTDSLFAAAAALGGAQTAVAAVLRDLTAINHRATPWLAGVTGFAPAAAAEFEMDAAYIALTQAHATATALADALRGSAAAYGATERAAEIMAQVAAGGIAYGLGLSMAPSTRNLVWLGRLLAPTLLNSATESGSASSPWSVPFKFAVDSNRFASLTRLAVMSADEFGTGTSLQPPWADPAWSVTGDQGLSTSIAALRDLGRVDDRLEETPIITQRTSSDIAPPPVPTGWADRASRIPDKGTTDQVRIDTYQMPDGSKRYEVYIGGTREFGIGPDDQPWDMTSNLVGIEGDTSGSMVAVENAMRESGITSDSPVLITGHSQGGLVAASIAQSGNYDVQGLFTLGAPAAQSTVSSDIPWVALEHSNDIVPALSGAWEHSEPVIVTREVGPLALAGDPHFFAPHMLPEYERTAALTDASGDPRVEGAAHSFDEFTAGAIPILTETYTSVRQTSAE